MLLQSTRSFDVVLGRPRQFQYIRFGCFSEIPSHGMRVKVLLNDLVLLLLTSHFTPVRTPGFKSRIRPPYPQRFVKGD